MTSLAPVLPDHLDRQAREHAALTLWLTNVLIGVLIGTAYLTHLPEELSWRAMIFVGFGLVSSVATLALVPALLFWLSVRFLKRAGAQGLAMALTGAAFLSLVKVDTVVFSLLRYHFFSSAVLNVAITEGSEDAVHLGWHVWWPVAIVVTLLTGAQYLLWRRAYRKRLGSAAPREFTAFFTRPTVVWGLILLTVVGVEKTIYAAADLDGDRQVHNAAEVLPAYPRLRVSRLLSEETEGGVTFRPKGAPLQYPIESPVLDPDPERARPNILILVLDSWRKDMLSLEHSPELYALSRGAMRFENHQSGGNGTRFGVFSMLYGLHGTYWFSVLEERQPPVLLEVLAEAGYERRIYSAASMDFPEFRDTAWVNCPEHVYDDHPYELPYECDEAVAKLFAQYLAERGTRENPPPFFSFILLDAPHQPYSSPPDGPYEDAAERLDYIELAGNNSPDLIERVQKRYWNAVRFSDHLVAGMLENLRASGELENTIVLITGDHGEEFQENGFWGHTSNFTPQQVSVPLFLFGPGIEPGVEERPTSHLDLAPTLLELLGADPDLRPEWSLGENLFDPPPGRKPVVSGWAHLGLIDGDTIFRVEMGGSGASDIAVFGPRWQPRAEALELIAGASEALQSLSEECERFLAPETPQ